MGWTELVAFCAFLAAVVAICWMIARDPQLNGRVLVPHEKIDEVYVEWKDPDSDWHWFCLLDTRGEFYKLQGRDSPEGYEHDGEVFYVHCSEVKSMVVEP